MTAIIDYGVGNLFSLSGSLRAIGESCEITALPERIHSADRIILPGVGAFADAAEKLRATGLVPLLKDEVRKGKPVLGICLGMQLLFERSLEYGEHEGLGMIPGQVVPLAGRLPAGMKVPHMGWNRLHITSESPLMKYTREGEWVYFVHSYYASDCDSGTVAVADYGIPVTAVVAKDNLFGTQFHPEKSGSAGLSILRAFTEV